MENKYFENKDFIYYVFKTLEKLRKPKEKDYLRTFVIYCNNKNSFKEEYGIPFMCIQVISYNTYEVFSVFRNYLLNNGSKKDPIDLNVIKEMYYFNIKKDKNIKVENNMKKVIINYITNFFNSNIYIDTIEYVENTYINSL